MASPFARAYITPARDRADMNRPGPHYALDCFAAPSTEPVYPIFP